MTGHRSSSTVPLAVALLAAATNAAIATQLVSYGRSLDWEVQSEWDDIYSWEFDGLMLIWGLLSFYFTIATCVCTVGVVGVYKRVPSYIRLFRDYSLVDLCFCTLLIAIGAFATFQPGMRLALCQELSSHPDLLRDLSDAGLNLENCESWFEGAVVVVVAVAALLLVIRLQFILTITNFYRHLIHYHHLRPLELFETVPKGLHMRYRDHESPSPSPLSESRRIFLLPAGATTHAGFVPSSTPMIASPSHGRASSGPHPRRSASLSLADPKSGTRAPRDGPNEPIVYAPLPLGALSPQDARNLKAAEAWVMHSPLGDDEIRLYTDDEKEL